MAIWVENLKKLLQLIQQGCYLTILHPFSSDLILLHPSCSSIFVKRGGIEEQTQMKLIGKKLTFASNSQMVPNIWHLKLKWAPKYI